MKTSFIATLSFLAGWSLAASTTAWYIVREEPPASIDKPIGRLVDKEGALDFRGQDDLLWRSAGLRQIFGKGSRVATGRASKATIALEGGRSLLIDADSLVVLTKQDSAFSQDQSVFIVTLAKGTVSIKEDPKAKAMRASSSGAASMSELILKTNDQIVTVKDAAAEVVLTKPHLQAPTKVDAPQGAVEARPVQPPPPPVLAPPSKPKIATSIIVEPRPEQSRAATAPPTDGEPAFSGRGAEEVEPRQEALARGLDDASRPTPRRVPERPDLGRYEPTLKFGRFKATPSLKLWSAEPVARSRASLPVTLSPPPTRSSPGWRWTPLLRIRAIGGSTAVLKGRPVWGPQRLSLPSLADLWGDTDPSGRGLTIELTAGVSGNGGKSAGQSSFSQRSTRLTLRSFADLPAEPLTVHLDLSGKPRVQAAAFRGFLRETPELIRAKRGTVWRIGLQRGRDIEKLLPLITGASAFAIERGLRVDDAADDVLCVVLDHAVIAVAAGSRSPTRADAARLVRLLSSDFAYLGPKRALIAKDADLKAIEATSPEVFAVNLGFGQPLYGVRRVFVGEYANLERFLKENALALFDRKVELLARKEADGLTQAQP